MRSNLRTFNPLRKELIRGGTNKARGQAVVEYALFIGAVCAALILALYSARGKFSAVVEGISKPADIQVGD